MDFPTWSTIRPICSRLVTSLAPHVAFLAHATDEPYTNELTVNACTLIVLLLFAGLTPTTTGPVSYVHVLAWDTITSHAVRHVTRRTLFTLRSSPRDRFCGINC